jgi:hypothetical protein
MSTITFEFGSRLSFIADSAFECLGLSFHGKLRIPASLQPLLCNCGPRLKIISPGDESA